jgi:acyl carrier protein
MSLHDRLTQFIRGLAVEQPKDLTDATELIGSGLINSLALFQLALWIEQEVGSPVDVSAVDLPAAWNTVPDIVRFIERQRAS